MTEHKKTLKNEIKEGVCPICGNEELDYSNMDIADGNYIYYNWKCPKCDTVGKEYYELNFIGHNVWDSKQGKEVIHNV
jgi:rubrerythrin